jgi:carboxyl-terminal processing protease
LADVRLGDQITHINQLSLKDKSTEELLTLVRGAPNTSFKLSLNRNGIALEKTITRMVIKSNSVSYSGLFQGNIAYIKLEEFEQNASKEIESSLKKMMEQTQVKGIILDLRDNGGGLLNEAVQIVGLFVGENKSVVTLKGQNVTGPTNWFTPNKAIAPNLPLVVLVNERSASASEVVSGSLQDMDRAVVMGQTSFGKGLVQNYVSLPYRTQMKLTTAKYYTPSGRCIQKLQYNNRDEAGQAKSLNKDQKRKFKTANGRTVNEGGGIDPDKFLDPYQGIAVLKWLEKEWILFDWANEQYNAKPDTLFQAVTDQKFNQFLAFAINKSELALQAKFKQSLGSMYDDTLFIQKMSGLQINNSTLSANLKADILAHKEVIKRMLNKEMMQRKLKKMQFFKQWLEYDTETKEAANLLFNSSEYQQLLSPPK